MADEFGGVPVASQSPGAFETKLSPADENSFQTWKSRFAPNDSGDDYDLRGAFKAGITPDPNRGHFPDTFKKPNHYTFSNESQYSGQNGQIGGRWDEQNGQTVFYASPTNLQYHTPAQMQDYFRSVEPDARLVLPSSGHSSSKADEFGGVPVENGAQNQQSGQSSPGFADHLKTFASHVWDQVNPMKMGESIIQTVAHPGQAVAAIGAQNADLWNKTKQAYEAGDYAGAIRHGLGYLANGIPGVGATLDKAGDETGRGEVAAGLGDTAGLAANLLGPEAAGKAASSLAPGRGASGVAERLYQSALKPSSGAKGVPELVQTGLQNKIPISEGGAAKIAQGVSDLNAAVNAKIAAGGRSGATVDPYRVADRLDDVRQQFSTQVNPVKDVKAVDAARQEFLDQEGQAPGQPAKPPQPTGVLDASGQPVMSPGIPAVAPARARPIPANEAQALKTGTYQQLSGKYGEMSNAQAEAQKALARGLKEELENLFPEIGGENAKEGKLIDLQGPLERAVNRFNNRSLVGVGEAIGGTLGGTVGAGAGAALGHAEAGGTVGMIAGAVLKRVLDDPALKSQLALAIHQASKLQLGGKAITVTQAATRIGAMSNAIGHSINNPSGHQIGDTVTLPGKGDVVIKEINPDGSFEY